MADLVASPTYMVWEGAFRMGDEVPSFTVLSQPFTVLSQPFTVLSQPFTVLSQPFAVLSPRFCWRRRASRHAGPRQTTCCCR